MFHRVHAPQINLPRGDDTRFGALFEELTSSNTNNYFENGSTPNLPPITSREAHYSDEVARTTVDYRLQIQCVILYE
jgi:hypothetical protein